MKRAHGLCALSAALMCLLGPAAPAGASALMVTSPSAKVCQLTGQTDWLNGQPTNAETQSKYGLFGIDLGFPVESSTGQLLLLFGDSVPPGHPPLDTVTPDDGTGWTTRTAAPNASSCLDMKMFSPGPGQLGHPVGTPAIAQGAFNVPTGGIDVDGGLYVFFWTNHCLFPNAYGPDPATPMKLPGAPFGAACKENGAFNSLGRSVLAKADPKQPLAFAQVAPPTIAASLPSMPEGFVYVTAAEPQPRREPVPPGHGKVGPPPPIPVFGVARYRAGIPYLALAPRASFGDAATWSFYGGTGASGPIWLTYAQWQGGHVGNQWAPPPGAELWLNSPNALSNTRDERCVGEHQASFNAQLGQWLMLYTCGGLQVEARTAPEPWGPWSKPTIILSAAQTPSLYCTLFWNLPGKKCPGRETQQPLPKLTFGYFYAPFALNRYTQPAPAQGPGKAAKIYWLLSTWDPYQVTVMQTTLQVTP
jgi:hypothetical protein